MDKINEIESFLGMNKTKLHKDFICVLKGQFSSGKSKFMNKLFGADYLPVGTREMTAVPTYIKKGKNLALIYKEKAFTEAPVEEIKKIKKGECDYEKIELSISDLNTPENLIFIDIIPICIL